MDDVRLIHGDCLSVLRTLESGSVDAVVTDPPYGTGAWLRDGSGKGRDCRAVHRLESWDRWSTDWLEEAWRVARCGVGLFLAARETASLLAWIGERPWRMFAWCRPDPRPRFGGQPAYGFDPFVVIGKVQPAKGKDWCLAASPRQKVGIQARVHPHQKPLAVMEWAIRLACPPDGVCLGPFMGSGTTGVACVQTGRRFLGIEIDEGYFKIAEKRIAEARNQMPLFSGTDP